MEIFWDRGGGICIGNNVFIGMKTTILKGVHIGDNVIIGANSLVNKDVPNNCVVAGNPARVMRLMKRRSAARSSSCWSMRNTGMKLPALRSMSRENLWQKICGMALMRISRMP